MNRIDQRKDTRAESSSLKPRPRSRLAGPHVNHARERSGRQPQQRSMRPQRVQRRPARRTRPRHKAERHIHELVGQLLCRGREVDWRGRKGILITPSEPWPSCSSRRMWPAKISHGQSWLSAVARVRTARGCVCGAVCGV